MSDSAWFQHCRLQTHLTVQFNVLGEGGVDLSKWTAEAAGGDVNEVLQWVHVIILHKVLTVVELWETHKSQGYIN